MHLNTIRSKLLTSFIAFSFILLFIILINYWFNQKKEKIQEILAILTQINYNQQTAKISEKDFFIDETINLNFYQTRQSQYLQEHEKIYNRIIKKLEELKSKPELKANISTSQIDTLVSLFILHNQNFEQLVKLSIQRGFKDYGLEGELRHQIHILEKETRNHQLDMSKLLTIRRHEKDFMLRKDNLYLESNLKAIKEFQSEIKNKITDKPLNEYLTKTLDNYTRGFLELVNIEKKIGLNEKEGIRRNLLKLADKIEIWMKNLSDNIHTQIHKFNQQNDWMNSSIIVLCLVLNLLLAWYITRFLSQPIRLLSTSIHQVIQNDFHSDFLIHKINTNDELAVLAADFAFMLNKVQASLDEIQQKNLKIAQKSQLLQDSLNYAQKIQLAVLPTKVEFKRFFADYFLIYSPMHTVSGDFYWLSEVDNIVFVAVVDCTGHGVPGAFMSVIANTLLNEIVNAKKIKDLSLILEILDLEVRKALKQDQSGNNDGMELGICKIEGLLEGYEQIKVTFAGAKGKVLYQVDNQVIKYKGTKRAIGGKNNDKEFIIEPFASDTLVLKKGDCIYLLSDGLIDQPNVNRKKFGKKRLLEVLNLNLHKPMQAQKEQLEDALYNYAFAQQVEQRDDITILGIRL